MTVRNLPALLVLAGSSATLTSPALAQTGSAMPSNALTIGSKAPAIKVAKWVKGEPTKAFELGKVYVVEFWATWCGPCIQSIPHLTGLQKKYGNKVRFHGIAISQREKKDKYLDVVTKFVTDMGAKMEYSIAADTEPQNGAMSKGWMTASGQGGIPTAFVVGKDGRIAWIGHPMDADLPKTLDTLLDGTYDSEAAKAAAIRKAQAADAMQTAFTKVSEAFKKNDDVTAEATMTALVAKYPETAGMVLSVRFNRHLDKGREKEAIALLQRDWSSANLNADDLNTYAWDLVDSDRFKTREYPLAIAMATKAVELTEEKSDAIIDTLARALFESGKIDEAIAWQQKAVDLTGGKDADLVATLAKYKKAKGN